VRQPVLAQFLAGNWSAALGPHLRDSRPGVLLAIVLESVGSSLYRYLFGPVRYLVIHLVQFMMRALPPVILEKRDRLRLCNNSQMA
jgi:hypothetical protein